MYAVLPAVGIALLALQNCLDVPYQIQGTRTDQHSVTFFCQCLSKCLLHVRLGKNLSVRLLPEYAGEYLRRNDTCTVDLCHDNGGRMYTLTDLCDHLLVLLFHYRGKQQ